MLKETVGVQHSEDFLSIGPFSKEETWTGWNSGYPSTVEISTLERHSAKHWSPLNCSIDKQKTNLLSNKAEDSLQTVLSSPLFKHIEIYKCEDFKVIETEVPEDGLNLDNGQERIKETFKGLQDFLECSGVSKHLGSLIFLHVHQPSNEKDSLRVKIGIPVSTKVEEITEKAENHHNISLVTYPSKSRVAMEIHHKFPLLGKVSRTRRIMDTRIVFMGAKALENVLSEAGLQPSNSDFYFVSHSSLKKVGLEENEVWIDLQ
eukprot:ctg_885.g298